MKNLPLLSYYDQIWFSNDVPFFVVLWYQRTLVPSIIKLEEDHSQSKNFASLLFLYYACLACCNPKFTIMIDNQVVCALDPLYVIFVTPKPLMQKRHQSNWYVKIRHSWPAFKKNLLFNTYVTRFGECKGRQGWPQLTTYTHQSSCKIEFQSSQFFSMHK